MKLHSSVYWGVRHYEVGLSRWYAGMGKWGVGKVMMGENMDGHLGYIYGLANVHPPLTRARHETCTAPYQGHVKMRNTKWLLMRPSIPSAA